MTRLSDMAGAVGALLTERGQTVAISESAAGGLISAALLSIPGASAYFLGGATVYTRSARRGLLRFNDAKTRMDGASEEYALLCAQSVRDLLDADWAVGESGAAGPTGSRYGYPAGHVALAVAGPATASRVVRTGHGDREENMWVFAGAALDLLYDTVKAHGK